MLSILQFAGMLERLSGILPATLLFLAPASASALDAGGQGAPAVAPLVQTREMPAGGWAGAADALVLAPPSQSYLAYGLAIALALGGGAAAWGLALRHAVQRRTMELEDERGRLRTLIDTLPDLVWLKDPEGVFLACNAEFELLLGAPEADIVGRTDYDFIPRELADFFRRKDAEAIAKGRSSVNEEEVVYASDGRRVLLETIKTPMFDARGRLIGVLGIGRDITARRAAEKAAAETQERFRVAFRAIPVAASIVRARDGLFIEVNDNYQRDFGWSPAEIIGRTAVDIGLWPDAASRGAWLQELQQKGTLVNFETVWYDRQRRQRRVSISAELTELHGEMYVVSYPVDVTEQRAAVKALAASEALYRSLYEGMPDGYVRTDMAGRILECNSAFRNLLGYGDEEIRQRTHQELTPPEWHPVERDLLQYEVLVCGHSGVYEKDYIRRDGGLVPVEIRVFLQRDGQGAPQYLWGIVRDISERKRVEAELRDRESYTKLLFDESRIALGVLDPLGLRFLDCNGAALAVYGLGNREALLALGPLGVLAPTPGGGADAATALRQAVGKALEQGAHVVEWRHRRPSGEEWDAEVHLMRFSHQGRILLQYSLEDITERKRQEKELRLAAQVYENTAEGIIITDPDGTVVAVNRAFTAITGYSAAEVQGQPVGMLRSGRHEPVFYREMWESLLQTGVWQGEIWNRRKNGEIFPEWQTISAVRDEAGRITHYVAVFNDITTVKRSQEALNFLAHHDPLTELPNRILLRDRLQHALQRAQREGAGLAVLFIDLDRFKHINDTLGHPVGDEILRQAARAMAELVRSSDTVARIGGDEFVVLLEDDVAMHSVATVAHKLVDRLTRPFEVNGRELYVTASIGISLFPNDGEDADVLLKNADLAMYKAKEQGRNNFQFYEAAMGAGALERLVVENALRGAVQRRELLVHYQPQINLATGELAGVEALVRWRHPELGLVSPGHFIPVAEEMGIIGEIGDWVLRESCRQLAAWQAAGLVVPRVAVNLSMQQLELDGLVGLVARLLEECRLPAGRLELEVTESVIMRQTGRAVQVLEGLRQLGVYLAVDDFGTGYSSLGYLRQLPVHRLKIDYSFVRDIGRDCNDETIARAIIGLGRGLGLEVVAEGVEREEQAAFLRREGCDVVQGFLYGRPMAPEDLGAWQERADYRGKESGSRCGHIAGAS